MPSRLLPRFFTPWFFARPWTGGCTVIVCAAIALAGCSASPTSLTVDVAADKDVNPNAEGVANPIVLRLDLLRSKEAYSASEFQPLYAQSKTVLAQDLVSSNEMELRPGDTRTITIEDAKDATALGVLAAYRDIEPTKWRATYDLVTKGTNRVTVRAGLGAVEVARKKRGFWFWLPW